MAKKNKKPLKRSGKKTNSKKITGLQKALFYAGRTAYNVPLVYVFIGKLIYFLIFKSINYSVFKIQDTSIQAIGLAKLGFEKLFLNLKCLALLGVKSGQNIQKELQKSYQTLQKSFILAISAFKSKIIASQFYTKKAGFSVFIVLAVATVLIYRFLKFIKIKSYHFIGYLSLRLKNAFLNAGEWMIQLIRISVRFIKNSINSITALSTRLILQLPERTTIAAKIAETAQSINPTPFLNKGSTILKALLLKVRFQPKPKVKASKKKIKLDYEVKFRIISFKTLFVIIFLIFSYISYTFYLSIVKDIPSADALKTYDPNLTTKIYDRKGNLLYSLYFDEDRSLVGMGEIPQDVVNATIAIEDESFYSHKGISVRGIIRAAKKTFLDDDIEGGSTITQQLVKNIILSPERTYERKVKEMIIALDVERRFTKNQIMEMYLNNISYGGTAYGIKSAAKKYFGKELSQLNLAEITYLVGLPGAPSKYSPFGDTPEKGKLRQWEVLDRMVKSNFITQETANLTYDQELVFQDKSETMKYPHFVNYVIKDLEAKYGQYALAKGGLEVYTSIDPQVQDAAQEITTRNVEKLARNKVSNGAILVANPSTGEILAMVGSANYWDPKRDGNVNLTTALRQPGSSIKPVTYSLALERGFTPFSEIVDEPVSYEIKGQKDYRPVNYDGRFHGKMTLKTALANSYNIPAVKLADQLGVSNLINWGEKMGITTWTEKNRYGLSLTLGAGEVKMTDLVTAYGVFANHGIKRELNPIVAIYDSYGSTVYENPCMGFLSDQPLKKADRNLFETSVFAQSHALTITAKNATPTCSVNRVLKESTAYNITMMLSDNKARTPAFGPNSNLNISKKQIAVKTGTTSNLKDNWAIGYTDDFVVASWIGNNNGQQMVNIASGYASASVLWRETFDYLINSGKIKDKISIPSDLVEVEYCPVTETLSCQACAGFAISQVFEKSKIPDKKCSTDSFIKALKNKHPEYFDDVEDGDSYEPDFEY